MEQIDWLTEYKPALIYGEKNPSLYDNTFPNNCLGFKVVNGVKFKTGDCWNGVVKAPIWTHMKGFYDWADGREHYLPNSDLGDWDGATILAHCYDRSSDMSNIEEGEFLYLVYQGGSHAGVYMGEIDGKRKVAEFTPIWENGLHFSDIANDGTRSYKGVKCAVWQEHGKMPWVKYPSKGPLPITPPTEDITQIPVEGDSDEHLTPWQKLLIKILFAVAKAINKVYNNK